MIEASSYQLDYSQLFTTKYAAILNISPDHLERHKTLKNYIFAKFRLIQNQKRNSIAFVNKHDKYLQKEIKKNKYKSKIVKVETNLKDKIIDIFQNSYFSSVSNKENLAFVIEIAKRFKVKKNSLIKAIKNFKGLKYRQQIIFENKNITVINDSKSTSYSSSIEMLKKSKNIYWLLGGIPKKGDEFNLPKKYFGKIRAFIYGKNKNFFIKKLNGKIKYYDFDNLKEALKKVFVIIKLQNSTQQTILFSPCAASFDKFKNFEERGLYFNNLIKKYLNGKKKINI